MFKKIAVIVAMLGIAGGAILTPLFSARAQTAPPAIEITSLGTTEDNNGKLEWTIGVKVPDDVTSNVNQRVVTIKITESSNGGGGGEILSDPVNLTNGVGEYKTGFVLDKTKGYFAKAQHGQFTSGITYSNEVTLTITAQGGTTTEDLGNAGTLGNTSNPTLPVCWNLGGINVPGCLAQGVYYALFVPTSFIFSLSGQLLDWAMSFTLDPGSYKGAGAGFVESGWKITRDIANILFIFILLWTGIGTILGSHSVDAKKTIGMVIIIALLLNFSLFFARVIIDASNILGGVFYNNIGTTDTTNVNNPFLQKEVKNVSVAIVSKFNPQSMFEQSYTLKLANQSGVIEDRNPGGPPASQFAIISLIMAVINCVGIWVFLTVALLFITRVAGLWLAMIFAPIAFISYILPSNAGSMLGSMHHSKWWGNLIRLAMVVPVFMFFMYLILKFMNTNFLSESVASRTTTQSILGVIIPLIIIAVLLTRARKIALDWSGEIGGMAAKAGTFVAGGAVGALAGGYAMLGRATVGRFAYNASKDEGLKDRAAKGGLGGIMARAQLGVASSIAKSSFDVRNTKAGNQFSKQTGMNLNSGLSFAGLDTKGTDGGWLGLQARKAEKDKKYGEELGHDEHAYKHEEEKIDKEKEKQGEYKDIKEDLLNKIRVLKEQAKQEKNEKKKDDLQGEITKLTQRSSVVDQNYRAYEKGGRVYSTNRNGEFLDKDGKVTEDISKAKIERSLGIQTMEKNKERIKTARQKQWQSTLQRRSGKVFLDDDRDELGNIKKLGKELTTEYKKEIQENYDKKKSKRSEIAKEIEDIVETMKTEDTPENRDLKARKEAEFEKVTKELNQGLNKLRQAEASKMKHTYQWAAQLAKEFGEGAAKGAVVGGVAGSVVPGIGTISGALGGGLLLGMQQAFMSYSGKTNQSHAEGHLPHYHGGHSTYHEPSGGVHDTPSTPSSGGGDDHSHGH